MTGHTVSAAALVSRGDEILLVRNKRRGWEFPGGLLEQGESVMEGLLREIYEETGVHVRVVAFVGAYSHLQRRMGYGPLAGQLRPNALNLTFLCEYVSGEARISEESTEIRWAPRDSALRAVTDPLLGKQLEDMLDYDGRPVFCAIGAEAGVLVEEIRI